MSWHLAPARALAQAEHAARWRDLHQDSGGSPLLAPEFVTAALAVFGSGAEYLAWHERAGQVDIMTIVTPTRHGVWSTFQPAQAPVGFWLQRDTGAHTADLPGLLRRLPGLALMLGVTQCDPCLMARPSDADDASVRVLDYIDTARITLAGNFDDYWQARGKNLRTNLRKQRKRLHDDGVPTRLQVSRAAHEMAAAVDDYGRLESAGWKAGDGTAVAGENDQGRFYRALLEAFAQNNSACVYRYWIGERLAAMDLCIEGGGCVVVLKTAYDEATGAGLSPALLMREEATRDIFEAKRFTRIEFYGRVMEWHLRWTDEVRGMYHLNAYRWPLLRQVHLAAMRRRA